MGKGHPSGKPAGQGSMAQPHEMPAKRDDKIPRPQVPPKGTIKNGVRVEGVGGSKKS